MQHLSCIKIIKDGEEIETPYGIMLKQDDEDMIQLPLYSVVPTLITAIAIPLKYAIITVTEPYDFKYCKHIEYNMETRIAEITT